MEKILFSVIIPVYNGERFVNRCLDSLIAQTYSNWEAIVVDNYSEDTTEELVKKYDDSRIKYYKYANHGVIAASRNFGVEKSKGDWICFLDIDDWWVNNKLEVVYNYSKDYEFVYHHLFLHYANGNDFLRAKISKSFSVRSRNPVGEMLSVGNPIQTSGVSLKKTKFQPFDVEPRLSGIEDFDLWLRIFRDGIKHRLIDEPLGYYHVGNTFSRNYAQIARERRLLSKWTRSINKEEKRLAILCHYYHSGCLYYENREYKRAISLWKKSITSSAFEIKKKSFLGIVKAFLRRCV